MRLVLSESIGAPLPIVFQVFTDLRRAPELVRSIQELVIRGSGPVGRGTRFRVTRKASGRAKTEELEITALEVNRTLTVESGDGGSQSVCTYAFKGDGEATEVLMTRSVTARSPVAKFLAPISSLLSGSVRRRHARDLADLRIACEERALEAREGSA